MTFHKQIFLPRSQKKQLLIIIIIFVAGYKINCVLRSLRISKSTTKWMRINTINADRLELNGEETDEVEDFAYLGSNISKDGGSDRDMQVRIGKARTAFTILSPVWKSKTTSRKTKVRIFNINVKCVLLYGSETWRVTKATTNKLQSFVNRCLRPIMGTH